MEPSLVVAGIAIAVGLWSKTPARDPPVPPPPCHCHCTCDLPVPPTLWTPLATLLALVVFALGCALSAVLFYVQGAQKSSTGSPKGGKGIQGLSSRFMQLSQ